LNLAMINLRKIILQFELLSTYYSKSSCKMSYTPFFRQNTTPCGVEIFPKTLVV